MLSKWIEKMEEINLSKRINQNVFNSFSISLSIKIWEMMVTLIYISKAQYLKWDPEVHSAKIEDKGTIWG